MYIDTTTWMNIEDIMLSVICYMTYEGYQGFWKGFFSLKLRNTNLDYSHFTHGIDGSQFG